MVRIRLQEAEGGGPVRALTQEEIGFVRHMCEHAWVDPAADIDRAKLADQVDHLAVESGCEVDNCPCLDFAYQNRKGGADDEDVDRASTEQHVVLVMDVNGTPWQANLFVTGGTIGWLEFSSFSDDYPSRLPSTSDPC